MNAWRGGAEGKGMKESQPDSAMSADPDAGLDLSSLKSQPEPKSRVEHLTD